jgi:hypothetical protein
VDAASSERLEQQAVVGGEVRELRRGGERDARHGGTRKKGGDEAARLNFTQNENIAGEGARATQSDVQVLYVERVFFDELAA